MMEDWMTDGKSTTPATTSRRRTFDYKRENFKWDRSSSEPDLSNTTLISERWSNKFLHEYVSVDALKYFRKRNPIDFHTRSSIQLYNKDEPILPFSSLKTEYKRRFKIPALLLRPSLLRRHTILRLEGDMGIETEHKANYLPYPEEEILRCRPTPTKNPEQLKLCGKFEFAPEYKSSFVVHPLTERSIKILPKETIKSEGIFNAMIDTQKQNTLPSSLGRDKQNFNTKSLQELITTTSSTLAAVTVAPIRKIDSQKCHLKLEGEMNYIPEYRSKFIEFPIEKSQSIPQLSSIKFHGNFEGVPEYRESFKFYDSYSKSAPIKKDDHISFNGKFVTVPEYKEKFKEPDKTAISKTVSMKTEDNLKSKGDFTKTLPEYNESFKDPKIKEKPERGKCREPYLRLKGKIEFNPEYRSTYLDYPRSRPLVKKSTSSIRLSNNTKNVLESPRYKFKSSCTSTKKFTDPNQELPFTCQPEYRKAKREYMIKERPITRKITENDGTVKIINKNDKDSVVLKQNAIISTSSSDQKNLMKKTEKALSKISTKRDISPQFRLNVDTIQSFEKKFHKPLPKYGRRALIRNVNHNASREKTKIIECNTKYRNKDNNYYALDTHAKHIINNNSNNNNNNNNNDSSFIILEEPCKKNAWMKKSWYES